MLGEIWEKHRPQVCAGIGAVLFLASGFLASVLSQSRRYDRYDVPPARQTASPQRQDELPKEKISAEIPGARSEAQPAKQEPVSPKEHEADWYLYITGSVRKPGVYSLPPGSRLFQLVDAAGGLNSLADRVAVNLAAPLSDGLHVHIPSKGESKKDTGSKAPSDVMVVTGGPSVPSYYSYSAPTPQTRTAGSQGQKPDGLEKIDINRAPVETLVRLRGIGPALARRIVEYRQQHGPFQTVEDLIRVRGIGAAKLKGMRGQAVVVP